MTLAGSAAEVAEVATSIGLDATVEKTLDLVGVFVFAISGGLLAVRKGYELVGVASLATATGLGGGVLRDVIVGATPPTAFVDVWYLVMALVAAAVVFVGHATIERRLHRSVLVFDAAGLGLFCVTGALTAAVYDTSAVGAVLIGVIAATGGGIIRDVLAGEQPGIFQPDSTLYAIPATLGATVIVVTWHNDRYSGGVAIAAAVGVFVLRLAALRYGWRSPLPRPGPANRPAEPH